ncbi:cyclin-U2-1 [Cryptomeria japonica]|uniref:cyclin-U2-1 n=1 Tax=Cryptomeria japonica TaxID=3369 RepID=UPI0025AB6879|nr:cyclin-U2-1 [Cryptomeria japonica]
MRETTGSDLYSAVSCSDLCSGESDSSPWILSVLASLLERLVARHERMLFSSGKKITRENLCVFSAMQIPAMSLHKYLERMFKYVRCSPSAFVVAYAYIDRLILSNPNFRLTSLNIHRLTITTVMVATKFLDDLHYNNDYFAKVGGLTLREMNILEVEFLFMLRFRLQVTVSVFESYCSHFKREVSLGGGFQIERTILSLSNNETKKSCRLEESKKQTLGISYSYAGC